MDRAARPLFHGRSGDGWLADGPGVILRNQVDVDALVEGDVRLVLGTVWPPFRLRPTRDERDEALAQLRDLQAFARTVRGFALAKDANHAEALLRSGYVTVVPTVEGAEGVRRPEDVDLYFAAGARVITLVHFISNDIGGAAHGQLTRHVGASLEQRSDEGLTPVGRAIVDRMIALGIVIDLAHASDRLMEDVLTLTEAAGVPVLYSHAGARAFTQMERNLPDELAVRIARSGGIIGVTLFDSFLEGVPESAWLPDHQPGTCDDVLAHWLHFAQTVGPQNVMLGSDFNGFVRRPAAGGRCPDGLRHTGDLAVLFAALAQAGVPEASLDGGGKRFLDLWAKVEARADAAARAQALRGRAPATTPLRDTPL